MSRLAGSIVGPKRPRRKRPITVNRSNCNGLASMGGNTGGRKKGEVLCFWCGQCVNVTERGLRAATAARRRPCRKFGAQHGPRLLTHKGFGFERANARTMPAIPAADPADRLRDENLSPALSFLCLRVKAQPTVEKTRKWRCPTIERRLFSSRTLCTLLGSCLCFCFVLFSTGRLRPTRVMRLNESLRATRKL